MINAMGNIKVRNIETSSSKESTLRERTRFGGKCTSMSHCCVCPITVAQSWWQKKRNKRQNCLESYSSGMIHSRISFGKGGRDKLGVWG